MKELANINLTFTESKKEIKEKALKDALTVIDSGEVDLFKSYSNAVRLKEYINTFLDNVRSELESTLNEKYTVNGVSFEKRNGSVKYDFSKDEKYLEIENKLKERKEKLKLSSNTKETIFDEEGIEIPKLIKNYTKDSIVIKY